MVWLFGVAVGLGLLFLWLKGHWFGGVVAALIIFWIFQMATGDYHDPTYYVIGRGMISALVAFTPYLVGGRQYY